MNTYRGNDHAQRGAVLIAALITVVMIAAVAAISLSRASSTAVEYQENSRKNLSEATAQAALEKTMGEINNLMENQDEAGDLHGQLFEYTSRGRSKSNGLGPFLVEDPDFEDMSGDTERDQLENSDQLVASSQEENGTLYRGGIFRVSFEEWNDEPGSPGEYGTVHLDEPMETKGKSQPGNRRFSVKIEATYGNYMTEMWALLGTRPREGFAMFGSSGLSVGNNVTVDSYRSLDDHPYADEHQNAGNLGTTGDISIGSGTNIYGTAEFGGSFNNKGTVHDSPDGNPEEILNEPEEQTYENNSYTDKNYDFPTVGGDATFGSNSGSGTEQIPPGDYGQLTIDGYAEIQSGPVRAEEIVVNGDLHNPNGGEVVVKQDMTVQSDSTFDNAGGDLFIQGNYNTGDNVETYFRNSQGPGDPLQIEVQGGTGGGGQGLLFGNKNYMEVDGQAHIYSRDFMASGGFQLKANTDQYAFDSELLEEEGHVEFQLDGNVEVKPGGGDDKAELATDPDKPPALKFRVGGDVDIDPRGKFSMDLMAPNGTIDIAPHSQNDEPLRGRVYGDNVEMANNMAFEYDISMPSIMGHYAYRGSTTITRQQGGPRP